MRFGTRILEGVQSVSKKVLGELSKQVGKLFTKAQPKIQKDFRTIISRAIRSQPEYGSLKTGELRYNFGIPNVAAVDAVVDRFVDSINVRTNAVKVSGNTLSADLIFSIIAEEDVTSILSSEEAQVLTEKGQTLPWLQWLLLEGSEPLVLTHRIKIGSSEYSRTGQAIMIPTKNGNWRVPPRYIGTVDNNWITRAISSVEGEINNILSKHIK